MSTADQSLDRQKEETWSYAVNDLGVDPSTIEVYEDTGTGRDTQRDGYQSLITDVRAGEVGRVIVLSLVASLLEFVDVRDAAERQVVLKATK